MPLLTESQRLAYAGHDSFALKRRAHGISIWFLLAGIGPYTF
jgi:hypothetical protein